MLSSVPGAERVALGHPLVDDYLEVVRARCRRNTLAATAYDLKVFFTVVGKDPMEVCVADVLRFIRSRRGVDAGTVVRLADGGSGLALSTVRRPLSSLSGFYGYLTVVGVVEVNPVLRGMTARTVSGRVRRRAPLVRQVRRLAQVLVPEEVNALLGGLRRWRDRAMIEAMLLGGLRRSELLGLRLADLRSAERRVFVADGKGGHQRWGADLAPVLHVGDRVPASGTTGRHRHGSGVHVVEGPASRSAVDGEEPGADHARRPSSGRARQGDLPLAAPHLPHPAAGGGHGVGSDPSPSWAPFDRVDPDLSAPRRRMGGRRVPQGRRGDRRPGSSREPIMTAVGAPLPAVTAPARWSQ
jgi:hypothetical protein